MKRFFLRMVLFLSPFLLALGIEMFILPIDFFTFRSHEALVVKKFRGLLPGRFYPNQNLTREEEGDLGHHTKYRLKRMAQWITDSYGYRKKGSDRSGYYEVVIIGQSETFGAGLTQSEILSEILENELGLGVYPFAPAGINTFLKERRFIASPPKIVILSSVERAIPELPPLKLSGKKRWVWLEATRNKIEILKEKQWIQSLGVFFDRLYKMNMVQYIKASLKRKFSDPEEVNLIWADSQFGPILYLQGAKANEGGIDEEKWNRATLTIKAYHDLFKSRGIHFIFLPIPNKETIFYESLGTRRPVFLKQLVARLKQLGVDTVDTQGAFEKAYQRDSVLIYQRDDSHWNANGVQIAADLIKTLIGERGATPHALSKQIKD